MPADPEVLSDLVAALQRTPDAVPLRLHLAGLLLDSGAEGAALEHYGTVLGQQPSNLAALDGAARACDRLGLHDRTAGYRAIHAALQDGSASPPDAPTASSAGKAAETPTGGYVRGHRRRRPGAGPGGRRVALVGGRDERGPAGRREAGGGQRER